MAGIGIFELGPKVPGHDCKALVIFYVVVVPLLLSVVLLAFPFWVPGVFERTFVGEGMHEVDWPSFSEFLHGYVSQDVPAFMSANTDHRRGEAAASKGRIHVKGL